MILHIFDPSLTTTKVRDVLEKVESFIGGAYWDSATPKNPTIGIGFNINTVDQGNINRLRLVLEKLYGPGNITNVTGFIDDFTNGIELLQAQPLAVQNNRRGGKRGRREKGTREKGTG